MEMTRGRISFTFDPRDMLLSLQMGFIFWVGSLVVLDVVFRYLSLFLLYINIKIGKNRC